MTVVHQRIRHGRAWSVADLLAAADEDLDLGVPTGPRTWATGFRGLDAALCGGVRAGELVLLTGAQGIGKTTLAVQVARNVVGSGGSALVLTYDQDGPALLDRLITLETACAQPDAAPRVDDVRSVLERPGTGGGESVTSRLSELPGAADAARRVRAWGERLVIHEASGRESDVSAIAAAVADVRAATGQPPLVVLDHLQKVPDGDHPEEDARTSSVVAALKDLARDEGVPVLVLVAADKEALASGRRLRIHDMQGPSSLAYEADVVLVANVKYDIVARHHLVYATTSTDVFRGWLVLTVEKNRRGPVGLDLELERRLDQARFLGDGRPVQEQLVDGRIYTD